MRGEASGVSASADADVGDDETPIYQDASGGLIGTATLTNATSSTLSLAAVAAANGSDAACTRMQEFEGDGIAQYGEGVTTGSASLTNAGMLTLSANATAKGLDGATADASMTGDAAIYQYASATGTGGSGSVALQNSGTLSIVTKATATSTESAAFAHAGMDTGIEQYAQSYGSGGATALSLTNSGFLNIANSASAFEELIFADAVAWDHGRGGSVNMPAAMAGPTLSPMSLLA